MNWNEEPGRTLLKGLAVSALDRNARQTIDNIAFCITSQLIDAQYSLHELGLIDAVAAAVGEKVADRIRKELRFIRDVQDSGDRISPEYLQKIVSEDTNKTINA